MNLTDVYLFKLRQSLRRIPLTEQEERIVRWLAGWDDFTVDAVCSLLDKAREADPPA